MSAKKLKPLPWGKLSEEAAYPKSLENCQCCGVGPCDLITYVECDEADRQTTVAITVCEPCAKMHVEPHARFYHELEHNRPFPGAMSTCIDCPHRVGLTCTHHLLKSNGGPGLMIRGCKEPTPCFFDGAKDITGVLMDYGRTPPSCSGRPIVFGDTRPPKLNILPASSPAKASVDAPSRREDRA
jgi:hypothetical protein